MKRIIFIIAMLLVFVLGCDVRSSNTPDTEVKQLEKDESAPKENVTISTMFGTVERMTDLSYDGGQVVIPIKYSFEGLKKSTRTALFAFLDGIPQVLDDESGSVYKIIESADGEEVVSDIEFVPMVGLKGDSLQMVLCALSEIDYKPKSVTGNKSQRIDYIFDFLSCPEKVQLDLDAAGENAKLVSMMVLDSSPITKQLKEELGLEGYSSDEMMDILFRDKDGRCKLSLSKDVIMNGDISLIALGTPPGRYRVTLFVNREWVKVNGHDFLDVTIEKDKYLDIPLGFASLDHNFSHGDRIFAVLAPRDVDGILINTNSLWVLE